MTHGQLVRAIRLALGDGKRCVLWLNASGRRADDGTFKVRPGLCVGSADILGLVYPNGRFIALEVKVGKDTLRPEQKLFLDLVNKMGGVGAEVRSVDDAFRALQRAQAVRSQ